MSRQDICFFLSFCVEQFKARHGLSGREALGLFNQYDVMNYLAENCEVLHTQSHHWIVEDIDEFIALRKSGQ